MAPVYPVLIPQVLRIDASEDQARYHNAANFQCPEAWRDREEGMVGTRWIVFAKGLLSELAREQPALFKLQAYHW